MGKNKSVLNEKYRPKTLDEIAGQKEVVNLLKGYVKTRKVPHMLFNGPAGTGKTTSAKALARDLYGKDWRQFFIEMNASDDNSIEVIRSKVKQYAEIKIIGEDYKIIFLDEADHLSGPSQAALRRIIEMHSEKCRFILSCNYPNKIIDPIKDRCTMFRFKRIKPAEMKLFLKSVAKQESIDITDSALELLCKLSKGSMRASLGTLEKLNNANITSINEEVIRSNFCYVNDQIIKELIFKVSEGDIDAMYEFVEKLLYEKTYEPDEIIVSLDRLLRTSKKLPNDKKAEALIKLGEVDYRISVGANAEIQLKTFAVFLYQLYKGVDT